MMYFDVVNDIPTTNKTIFLLSDLDVPIDENGNILNDEKIKIAMPTINYLVKTGARVVIATHLGAPSSNIDIKFSTKPIAKYLDKRMNCEVNFTNDCIGEIAKRDIFRTEYGDIIVLENLLFHKEEVICDMNFARQLAEGMNIYVNDSFEYSNQPYSSVLAVPLFIRATGGIVLADVISKFNTFLNVANKFTMAIIGGQKIEEKIDLLNNLVERVKCLVLGGEIGNAFLAMLNKNIGKSIYNDKYLLEMEKLLKKAEKNQCLILYPKDVKVINKNDNIVVEKDINEIEKDDIIVDIGKKTIKTICDILEISRCVFWYGNLGISLPKVTDKSVVSIADKISYLTKRKKIFSIVSGSDMIMELKTMNYLDNFSFTSYSSQSTLQYMSGKVLPGIEVLKRLSKQMV